MIELCSFFFFEKFSFRTPRFQTNFKRIPTCCSQSVIAIIRIALFDTEFDFFASIQYGWTTLNCWVYMYDKNKSEEIWFVRIKSNIMPSNNRTKIEKSLKHIWSRVRR